MSYETIEFQIHSGYAQSIYGSIHAGWHKATTVKGDDQIGDPVNSFMVGIYVASVSPEEVIGAHVALDYFKNGWEQGDQYRHYHTLSLKAGPRVNISILYLMGGAGLNYVLVENRNLTGIFLLGAKIVFGFRTLFGLNTPERSARTYEWLATAPELESTTAEYFEHLETKETSEQSQEEEPRKRLWAWTAAQTGVGG